MLHIIKVITYLVTETFVLLLALVSFRRTSGVHLRG